MEAEFSDSGSHKLQVFLTNNPQTGCSKTDEGDVITSPWGERTIKLRIDEEDEALVDALNTLYLPPRFTAIWHRDTKDLEVIYGPLAEDNETRSRSFDFDFGGTSYSCEFGAASERLLLLAKSADLEEEGGFLDPRNLMMLRFYIRAQERQSVTSPFADLIPTSFWIRGIENWDENVVVDLVQHLNFYKCGILTGKRPSYKYMRTYRIMRAREAISAIRMTNSPKASLLNYSIRFCWGSGKVQFRVILGYGFYTAIR